MFKRLALVALALNPLLTCVAATAIEPGSPAAAIDTLQSALIANMRSKDDCSTRLKTLEPKVADAFDFDFIAQKLVRRHWKELDQAQQGRLRDAVQHSAATTYATQFNAFGGEKFQVLATAAGAGGQHVTATLTTGDGELVPFDYALHQVDGRWKIINVVAQGVSDIAIRSAQYDATFTREGFDGLLKMLGQKDKEALASCGSPP